MKFVHGLFLGFVLTMTAMAVVVVKMENNWWNRAISKAGYELANAQNKFAEFDQTYDLGYRRCQEENYRNIMELKRD